MVYSAAITCIASLVALISLLTLVAKERRSGRRFFASRFRGWLDVLVDKFESGLIKSCEHFVKYIVQLNWYYSIHSVLRTILRVMVRFYTYFEVLFERNRERTKRLRSEKRQLNELNHLRQMAEYKEDTALTPLQKKKLRHKKLEEKH